MGFGNGARRGAGRIIAIGGAEDRTGEREILRRVIEMATSAAPVVGVVTTASGYPDDVFASYEAVFGDLGAGSVHHFDIRDREGARDPGVITQVEACDVVFMSGGDQLRLTNLLGGSPVLQAMRRANARGALIAGTSAGAACMSATMIYDGQAADALRKGAVKMTAGLAFVDGVVIDSHFLERGRFTRLMEVGATNPSQIGIGIGEDAAVIVHPGRVLEAAGKGHVIIVDSTDLHTSNVAELHYGEPVAVSHVVMHALTRGFGFDVAKRRFLRSDDLERYLEGNSHADPGTPSSARAQLL